MAKQRKKKRTQSAPGGKVTTPGSAPNKPGSRTPKSMVIRTNASEVGPSVTQLVQDVRSMLQPETAVRLKERRNNKLRDFTSMAGPLGVTHLIMFSRSKSGNVNCRVAVTPRGPTLSFRVEGYSLCKDVQKSQRRPKGGEKELYTNAPLLVMNNFVTADESESKEKDQKDDKKKVPKHLETLMTTVFQSLFPPINPTAMPLNTIKRALLMDRQQPSADEPSFALTLRHYAITTRTPKSVPKPLRRLDAAKHSAHAGQKRKRDNLPNLGRLGDVSDFLLDPHAADGFTSGSESELETDAEVEVLASKGRASRRDKERKKGAEEQSKRRDQEANGENTEKKAVKLQEIGPRLRLRLTKVEEGLCAGKVMWHEYIHKSPQELKQMEKMHEQKRQEKARRKAEQKANVEKKKKDKEANGTVGDGEDNDEEMEDGMDEWDDYDSDLDGKEGVVGVGAEDEEDEEMDEEEDDG